MFQRNMGVFSRADSVIGTTTREFPELHKFEYNFLKTLIRLKYVRSQVCGRKLSILLVI